MNALIMGSFLAVALLAFLAALWLAYTEKQDMQAKMATSVASVPTTPAVSVPVSMVTVKDTHGKALGGSAVQFAVKETPLPIVSNGQLYELVHELCALHTQANEINKRLLTLTAFVKQLQEIDSNSIAIREELAV